MSTQTTTTSFSSNVAIAVARSIASGNNVYLAISNPFASNSSIETAVDSSVDKQQVTSTLIGGYRIGQSDIAVTTTRINWHNGGKFDQYSSYQHTNCFVVTQTAGVWYVYKCLNNNDSVSTVKPTGVTTQPFTTADGYVWQYMWSYSNTLNDKFASTLQIPIVEDVNVRSNTVSSTIDSFIIEDTGRGYHNYYQGTFGPGNVSSDTLTVYLGANASSTNNFYNNCIIENTTPTSDDYGVVRTITSYNGTTKAATLDVAFNNTTTNDEYQVRPKVLVTSQGSNNVVASALINVTANTVDRIVVHSRGSDHLVASANVYAHPSVGISAQATITPIVSPINGHGGDIFAEVPSTSVVVSKTFNANTLSDTTAMTFATASLVTGPNISGVTITGSSGQMNRFVPDEQLIGYRHIGETIGQATANATILLATGNNTFSGIASGDTIVVANTTALEFATINAVTNSTSATIYGPTANIAGNVYIVKAVALGTVATVNTTTISVGNYPSGVNIPVEFVAGKTSKRYDSVANVIFADKAPTTLTGVYRISGVVTGLFLLGEIVTSSGGQQGQVVAVGPNTVSVFSRNVLSTATYTGQSSNASISSVTIVNPTYSKNTGAVTYITNSLPINITANKTINVKVAVSF